MQLESKKLLYDISQAVEKITRFLKNKEWVDYSSDELLKSAVVKSRIQETV